MSDVGSQRPSGGAEAQAGRTGQYVQQPGGYRAFVPEPLLPATSIDYDDELLTLLSAADRALGRLDGSIQTLPDPDLFVLMYVRKEAVLSSQIEGTQSSISDVLEEEARMHNPRRPEDVKEVLNYVDAMNYGLERLKSLPVSVRLVREIHLRLMRDVRGRNRQPGEIRETQNWVGPEGCALEDAIFVPPPPSVVPNALADLEEFLNHEEPELPALVRIGLAHAQFETIHPFHDGNGRVGRLLITFLLCQREILIHPVLYLSYYFRRHRQRYYDLLQAVRDHGDWESWLKFFLGGVAVVSNEATETARRIVELRERDRETIVNSFGRAAGNGLKILEHLFRTPIVQVAEIAVHLNITQTAANVLTRRLVEQGILTEITGKARNRLFRYSAYVILFAED